jgi:hypothetical protein
LSKRRSCRAASRFAQRAPREDAHRLEQVLEQAARRPELRLQAGMPVEVFITTPPRSLLEYLLEPVGVFTRRALREP